MENMKGNMSIMLLMTRPLVALILAVVLLIGGAGGAGAAAPDTDRDSSAQGNAQQTPQAEVQSTPSTPTPLPDDGTLHYSEYPSIRLRALDKITARTVTFDAQVGSIIKFADIYIKILSCRKPPAIEKTESAAFMQIWQVDKAASQSTAPQSHWVFSGWMFASSPALSAMDHPVYDVWVIDCLGKDPEEEAPPPAEDAPANAALPDEGEVKADEANEPSIAPQDAPVNSPQNHTQDNTQDGIQDNPQNPDIPNRYNEDAIPQENIPNTHMDDQAVPQNIPNAHNSAEPAFEVDPTPYQPGGEPGQMSSPEPGQESGQIPLPHDTHYDAHPSNAPMEDEPVINELPQDDSSPQLNSPSYSAPPLPAPPQKPAENLNGIY